MIDRVGAMRTSSGFTIGLAFAGMMAALPALQGPALARPSSSPAAEERVPLDRYTSFFAARGRSPEEVNRQLGPPDHRIYDAVWVYWNCESNIPEDNARRFDTMVIQFTNGRVSHVRLMARASVEAVIARVNAAKEATRNRMADQR